MNHGLRIAKRPRREAAGESRMSSISIDPLHQKEIASHVASFLGPTDLCRWDLICKDFAEIGKRQWNVLANDRFGTSVSDDKISGKDKWKLGISFMKEAIFVKMCDEDDFGHCTGYAGSARSTANQSILVTVADDIDSEEGPRRSFPVGYNGICVRDASNLNYIRTISSPICNFNVAICGEIGCEIIVTSNSSKLCAIRGNRVKKWHTKHGKDWRRHDGNGIFLLGCESHLIAFEYDVINLYDVDTADGRLVKRKTSVKLATQLGSFEGRSPIYNEPKWSHCGKFFSFYEPNTSHICVWEFQKNDGLISPLTSIQTKIRISTTILSESFVVGADEDRKLFVWDRHTGKLCQEVGLWDKELNEDEAEAILYGLSMTVVNGDLLVSSSSEGNALCVWNLKKRILLKRHTDAFDRNVSDRLSGDGGVDVSSMVYLKSLNTFVCMVRSMTCWSFPIGAQMEKRTRSICRREESMEQITITMY